MYANNEIGTIQPIREIAKIIRDAGEIRHFPFFHTDASQAFQFLDCARHELGIDLMTLSSHKIYGPKGAGALYIKQGVDSPAPQLTGGGQEFGLRSGTENIPAIVGFAKAVELIVASREKEKERIGALRDFLWRGIKKIYPKTELNGARESSPPSILGEKTLPNILNVYFPRHKAQDLLTKFDLQALRSLPGRRAGRGQRCRHMLSRQWVIPRNAPDRALDSAWAVRRHKKRSRRHWRS